MTKPDNSKCENHDLLKKYITKESKKENKKIKRITKIQLLYTTVFILAFLFVVQSVFIGYVMVKLQALNARFIKLEEKSSNNMNNMYDYAYEERLEYVNDMEERNFVNENRSFSENEITNYMYKNSELFDFINIDKSSNKNLNGYKETNINHHDRNKRSGRNKNKPKNRKKGKKRGDSKLKSLQKKIITIEKKLEELKENVFEIQNITNKLKPKTAIGIHITKNVPSTKPRLSDGMPAKRLSEWKGHSGTIQEFDITNLTTKNGNLIIKHAGLYYVYGQVVFVNATSPVRSEIGTGYGGATAFAKCVYSGFPYTKNKNRITCNMSGVIKLEEDDGLSMRVYPYNSIIDSDLKYTYFGAFMIGV